MKIGDKIAVVDEDLQGIIVKIEEDKITFLSDFGFEYTRCKDKLVIILSHLEQDLRQRKYVPKKQNKTVRKKHQKPVKTPVFDLHIEKIQPKHHHLQAAQILDIQLREVHRLIRKMKNKHYNSFVLIHGEGKGVLKNEITKILKKSNLSFLEADYIKYGRGAIRVTKK